MSPPAFSFFTFSRIVPYSQSIPTSRSTDRNSASPVTTRPWLRLATATLNASAYDIVQHSGARRQGEPRSEWIGPLSESDRRLFVTDPDEKKTARRRSPSRFCPIATRKDLADPFGATASPSHFDERPDDVAHHVPEKPVAA